MSQEIRDSLAELIYAAIVAAIGLVVAVAAGDWFASLGLFVAAIAGIYALYVLFEIARTLQSSSKSD